MRELGFQIGDTISVQDLAHAERQLSNLTFFNSVSVTADSTDKIKVDLREAWPILPALSVNFTEGSISDVIKDPSSFFDKATIYAGIGHINFRGNGGMLLGYVQFGAAQGFSLKYETRWFSPRLPVSLDLGFYNLQTSDREWAVRDSTAYVRDVGYSATVATHRGAPSRVGMQLQYRGIIREAHLPDQIRHARTVWFSPFVIVDRRDLEWYPTRGAFARADLNIATGDEEFIRSHYDLRGYFPLFDAPRPPLLALRFLGATSTSSTPGWASYYWGFLSAFRGYTGVKSQSSGYLLGDIELRFPITREYSYDFPFIGSYGERWPFSISGVLFGERAELYFDGRRQERAAMGAGLHFRVPYVQIIEFAYSVNRDGKTEYNIISGIRF